ncbi:hypothetical protein M9H77_31354 [Catharanthus roseus]|uniref:Uncharacterized protein n=1 Tax=Catharanthus roseus TaxID=4058 RepID=A0ACC0A2H5_CATRO|nr:hypothetical protein M9H77_31354 [Catharanthus roseus]
MPRQTAASYSSKRARNADPSSPENDPPIPSFLDTLTDRSNRDLYDKKKDNRIERERTLDPIFDNQLEIFNVFTGLGVVINVICRNSLSGDQNAEGVSILIACRGVRRMDTSRGRSIPTQPLSLAPLPVLSSEIRSGKKHNKACHRVGVRPRMNTGHSRNIWNFNDLLPRMRVVSSLIGEQQFLTNASDVISGLSISRSSLKNNETEKRWIARLGLSRREDFGHECARLEEEEDEEEEAEGSDEGYEQSDSILRATIEHMQIRQTQR